MKPPESLPDLHAVLGTIDWSTQGAVNDAADALATIGSDRLYGIYESTMLNPDPRVADEMNVFTRRKTTHTKLYLGGGRPDSRDSYVLWAQDYGQPLPNADECSYIDAFHDHRGNFVSVQIGEDGTKEDRISASTPDPDLLVDGFWVPTSDEWSDVKTHTYMNGEISVMRGLWDIHRVLKKVGAISLLVHAPRIRNVSQVFESDGRRTVYPDSALQIAGSVRRVRERKHAA